MDNAGEEIPPFPFFEVDDVTAAFGADRDKYLSRQEGSRVERLLQNEAEVFANLFYKGGRLSDYGLRFKPEYREEGFKTLRALMCSFAPSHQAKTGTVALALHHWCEPVSEQVPA